MNSSMPTKRCVICQKEFYAKPWHLKHGWARHCSSDCKNEGLKSGKQVPCATCGKMIYRILSDIERKSVTNKFFCNKSCLAIWKNKNIFIGKNHPQWKGGITYRATMIKSENLAKCTKCGLVDIRALVVHHIDCNRKNNSLKNLTWLCHNCHYLEHEGKTI